MESTLAAKPFFNRVASPAFGGLLSLYGLSALVFVGVLIFSGANLFEGITNSMGVIFIGFSGAWAFPLGFFLLRDGPHTPVLLRITSVALALNGMLRLSILLLPDTQDSVTPIVEAFVFLGLSFVALLIAKMLSSNTDI